MKAEEKEALPKNFDEYYKKYFLQNNEDQATKIWNDIICHLQTGLDIADELLSAQSREIEELKDLLKRVGNDRDKDITDLKAEIEELKTDLKIATSNDEELLMAINKLREQGF